MRRDDRRLCALRIAGYVPDAAFLKAQRLLSDALVSQAQYAPPMRPAQQAVHQAARDKSTTFSLGWHGGDKLAFFESAKRLPHPAQEHDLGLPQDLLDAIEFVVRKREGIVEWRQRRMALLLDCKAMVDPIRRRMLEDLAPSVRHVCADYDLAFMALIINATKHPDVYVVRHFLKGFPTHGFISRCGVFADGGTPPEVHEDAVLSFASNVSWNAYLYDSARDRGLKAAADKTSESWTSINVVWDATVKECADGWCIGVQSAPDLWRGFTKHELDAHPWLRGPGSWRAMRRFGVLQKGKIRPVDDGSENGLNSITGTLDKLSLIRPDSPAQVCAAYARAQMRWQDGLHRQGLWETCHGTAQFNVVDAYMHGSEDTKKAFRRIPCRFPGLMVVCVFNPREMRPEYFFLPSFVFGCYAAVLGWNRVTALYTHCVRRLLAVPATGYVDDFQVGGPFYDQPSAQASFAPFIGMFGPGFDEAKHVTGEMPAVNLGVLSDFSQVPTRAVVTLGVTDERKEKLRVMIRGIFNDRTIRHAQATKLFGKARFALCPIFGRVGLGVLSPLQHVKARQPVIPGTDVYESLHALLQVLDRLRPVEYSLFRRRDWAVVVMSDASFNMPKATGQIGVVVWCPQRQRMFYTAAADLRRIVAALRDIELKETYITQLELVAALCAYLTWPDVLVSRLVHHFIDNRAARSGLIKGSSGKVDSARIINAMHVELLALRAQTWFNFVYSEDNLSDPPSRGDFSLLEAMLAAWRPCILPRVDVWAVPRTESTGIPTVPRTVRSDP